MEKKIYTINQDLQGQRIDKAVAIKDTNLSRTMVQKMIDSGNIFVNGKVPKSSYELDIGDIVEIVYEEPKKIDLKSEDIPLDIIYQDDDILIINKQKGLVVHPGNGNPNGTLVNAIMSVCKDSLSGIGGEIRPGIVHRIDKDTSGLLIVAKNDFAHINISEQIKNHEVKKTYIALVRGIIKENSATIDMPIARSKNDRVKMEVNKNGKNAVTHFQVLKRYNGFTLIKVNIETGRTHQIRVHMSNIGFPLVGDMVYSNGKNPFGISGQMLHSCNLEFIHPRTNKKVSFEAELPKYFKEVLRTLESEKI
ncbi:MAG: RluA family pseudouridine synthase [Clostridia bacterium]|nr:RluA family pseudouridine synthase [Clostridia bacterium]